MTAVTVGLPSSNTSPCPQLRALAVKLKKRVAQLTAQAASEAEQRQKVLTELSQASAQLASSRKEAAALRLQAQNLQVRPARGLEAGAQTGGLLQARYFHHRGGF